MAISNPQSPISPQETRSLKQLLTRWQTAVSGSTHPQPPPYDGPDAAIKFFTEKTSEVEPGAGFVARVRATSDGHPYVGKAIDLGATFILAQRSPPELGLTVPDDVVYLQVEDTALTLAYLAAAWEDFPSRHLVTVGVTGTDGKSSTSRILFEILRAAGLKVGLVSTIKAVIGETEEPLALHVTTPEAPVVQRYLRRMVDAGLTHCILEATSHGLAQHRVSAVDFDVAVVTNITHEHLDYHGGYDGYFAAKARLFESLEIGDWRLETENAYKRDLVKTAVLNRDDSSYERLAAIPVPRQRTYAIRETADVTATDIRYGADKTTLSLHLPDGVAMLAHRGWQGDKVNGTPEPVALSTSLVGEFNVYNILAAAAAAEALGASPDAIKQGVEAVALISGRMERIDRGQDFMVVVDFAHTPRALEAAMAAGKRMVAARNGRTITVFGSAGKRDVEKRRVMAEVSARDADLTVLTAEDPRTESLDDILATMAAGCRSIGGVEGETFWRVRDRGRAIYFALTLAQPEDLVLICGKGHEQSMCFGVTEYPWDDREAARAALDAFLAGKPMVNLGLPTSPTKNKQNHTAQA